MAENDIYGNKERYERFMEDLHIRALPENEWRRQTSRKHRYRIQNPENVKYFRRLAELFDTNDLSYVHRLRQFQHLMLVAHKCEKDFSECTRDDINRIVAYMHTRYNSVKSKGDFITYLKRLWKLLFPEMDEKGLIDETLMPYVVRHLSSKIDRSKKKMRNDRLKWEEYTQIINFFAHDPRMQAYLTFAMESLGRPQEILTRKIKHVELYDSYAKVWLTEYGKEGPGLLQCIDSYPYLQKWLEQHPLKDDPDAWLFINTNNRVGGPLSPYNVNKHLRKALYHLGIDKRITCYSLKRNGVTFRRLGGESDMEIQHAARWTTVRQLQTYDLSGQEDAFQQQLVKRGMVDPSAKDKFQQETQTCIFCGKQSGFTDTFCTNCKRPLSRESLKAEIEDKEQFKEDFEMMRSVLEKLKEHLPAHIMEGLTSPETASEG